MFRARITFALLLAVPGTALAQGGPPQVIPAAQHDVSPPLRELPPGPKHIGILEAEPVRRIPSSRAVAFGPDPVLQKAPPAGTAPQFLAPATLANFDGIGNGFTGPSGTFVVNSAPPDTNGAVGPNHVVEVVNTDFAVFSKSGTPLFGPVPLNTLWSGLAGRCATENDGDPVVVYDRIADRWIISQFQVTATPFQQCVAVSTTADPTGSYFRYVFSYTDGFPDYPKMGVWPDGYYITYNVFNNALTAFLYSKVCAFDRARMLTGAAATQECFNTSSSFGGLLPADFDGRTLPAAGAPLPLVALGTTNTTLALWKFHSDFTTPASATFTGPTTVSVPSFTEACVASGGTCIPQSGSTQTLDSLSDRLMYRAAYRNFGDHEAIVVNHAVAAGSSVGLRWYELRGVTTTPSLFQSGTFAPDASFRWMGSAAMDQTGNIAIGYSVSSSSINPQIRITGRLVGDAAGTMTQGETTVISSGGAQGRTLSRWGDYSSLSVDPVDDCTFYYSSEYIPANGTFNWRTRIASFKLLNCGSPDFSLSASPASVTAAQGGSATTTVTVAPQGGFGGAVTLSVSGLPAGATASFDQNPTTTSSLLTLGGGTAVAGTYALTVTGVSGALTHNTPVSFTVTGPPPPADFALSAAPSSVTVTQGSSAPTTITVTPQNGFSGTVDLSVAGLPPGASGSFSQNPATTTSDLTLDSGTAAAGSYTLTVTGTSGTLTHTATVTFVVNPPGQAGFTISAAPASLSVAHGKSGTYTVTITRTGGFTGAVAFSVSGQASGVTATFSPASTAGNTSTLTISAQGNAPRVTRTLTITGASAGQTSKTATVSLTIR
jgi:hypothetical protein